MIALNVRRILRNAGLVLASIAASAAGPGTAASDEDARLTVVELFTSQGCSSCPPADALLTELANNPDVLALSLPIDYWDYLGWRDTLARPQHKARQHAYTRRMGGQAYTPEIVIDGNIDVVGNRREEVLRKVDECRLQSAERVALDVRESADDIIVAIGQDTPHSAALYLVRFDGPHDVSIGGGENRGRTVRYSHVVRDIRPLGTWTGSAATFHLRRSDLVPDNGANYAVILQENDMGPILGAANLPRLD